MKRLLLKISGEFLGSGDTRKLSEKIEPFLQQIQRVKAVYNVGIVVGGGNIVRGNEIVRSLGITEQIGHSMGMLATIINALCLQDILSQRGYKVVVLSAIDIPQIVSVVRNEAIERAFEDGAIVIFAGGTGQPFVSTDTAAVLYALRMKADVLWKCTKVDGIYDADPHCNKNVQRYASISYDTLLEKKLSVMDLSAIILAQQHQLSIRVMHMYHENTLIRALESDEWGSWIR